MRVAVWILGGITLGLIIHLVSILILPGYAENGTWARIAALDARDKMVVLPAVAAGADNPFGLDPKLAYAVCQLDLTEGPGTVHGLLPQSFWSVSVYDKAGLILYSTTNRSSSGSVINLGVFLPGQLTGDTYAIDPDMLVVEAKSPNAFVTVRLAPEQPVMLPRYREALAGIACAPMTPNPSPASDQTTDGPQSIPSEGGPVPAPRVSRQGG